MPKTKHKSSSFVNKYSRRQILSVLGIVALLIGTIIAIGNNQRQTDNARAKLARPATQGVFTIFGTAYTGDGLAPGWKNGSLFNGVNTWNIIETQQFYAGTHSVSWAPAAPFERGWLVSPNTPLNLGQYQFLNFYGRSTEPGQRLEVGFADQNGAMVGAPLPVESGGPPLQADRWSVYGFPLASFNTGTTPVYGIFFRDMNGAPQKKIFFDEIELSNTKAY